MNFFTWIREGVRQAVLYGVSDAVGDIGTPPNGEDVGQRLLEVIRTSPNTSAPAAQLASPRRKKLGRSLNDIQAGVEVERAS
jgi:hypothetical protein